MSNSVKNYNLNLKGIFSFEDGIRLGAGFVCGASLVVVIGAAVRALFEWIGVLL